MPDFRAELVRSAQGEDASWQEWYWHGTRVDGTRLEMRGVTIFGVQDDRILWGRLFCSWTRWTAPAKASIRPCGK